MISGFVIPHRRADSMGVYRFSILQYISTSQYPLVIPAIHSFNSLLQYLHDLHPHIVTTLLFATLIQTMSISSTKTRAALIPLTLALLSLTCATPLTSLLERAGTPPIQSAIDGLPACDSQATDPTWATGTSAFNDGDGVYLKSDCPAPGCVYVMPSNSFPLMG